MLAQQSPVAPILVWSLVLFLTVIAGFVLVSWARRRLTAGEEPPSGFSLADLRELHRSGQLSDQEYSRARERLLESMQRHPPTPQRSAAQRKTPASGPDMPI